MEKVKHERKEGVQLFINKELELEVRAVEINGEGWLIGKDVAEVLGYSNTSDALKKHVDIEDKGVAKCDTLGGSQEMIVINESGLYSLVLRSKLPGAKKFRRWVTSEVLPQIRKTGGYIPISEEMSEAEIMAKAFIISRKTIEKKDELLKAKDKEIKDLSQDLTQKNRFINQIAVSKNSLKVEEVAQIASKQGIKIGRNKLWDKLREWGLIKKNSKYDPKQEYIDREYFEVVEGTKENSKGVFTYKITRVLGKGQVYIIKRLLAEAN
ncbi:BRO family protein [Clostridium sp.]|uniref:BRO family protein n=1 Tax=Clostridium sp. TaxID=1506 RepID=UPI00399F8B81